MKWLLSFLFVTWYAVVDAQTTIYQERHRPQYHFTPSIHWMNDPNGLVYHKGEYHLFYQFNPFGNRWGHMSWGHAVSKDLVYWQHLPVAIPEEKDTMIFSGSCVVDKYNTAGFAADTSQMPMVAIYTGHIEGKNQSQHIAYSIDDGRTWTKYNRNPVLDLGKKDFRDPKVFWYAPHNKWVMAVALPIEKIIQFYSSKNLKHWEFMSDFGPAGDTSGIWECPDLFEVPVANEPGKTKWVLMHSPAPYMQYFVGSFDGHTFKNENPADKIFRPDYGPDYYAAIVFNDLPAGQKPISIGWVNNWNYANDIPTLPWKSAMSLPRELSVKNINGDWVLLQEPVMAIQKLSSSDLSEKNLVVENALPFPAKGKSFQLEVEIIPGKGSVSGIRLAKAGDHYFEIGYDEAAAVVYLDRSKSGDTSFHSSFPRLSRYETSVYPASDKKIFLSVFFDQSIVEVFVNNGGRALTAQLFPAEKNDGIGFFSNGATSTFRTANFKPLKSIW